MASARTGHLLVCDGSGRCSRLVTHAQLAAVRDGSAYSDRVRLRDILGDRGPFTSPVTTMAEAGHMMRYNHVDALPVVDEHGSALGVLALARSDPSARATLSLSSSACERGDAGPQDGLGRAYGSRSLELRQ